LAPAQPALAGHAVLLSCANGHNAIQESDNEYSSTPDNSSGALLDWN